MIAAVGCLVVGLLLPAAAALGAYAYFQVFERITPGVFVGETRLGGMTVYDAAVELHKIWNLERVILVDDGIQSSYVSPPELGLSVDPLQTAQIAFEVGHGGNILTEMYQMLYSLLNGWAILPSIDLDAGAAQAGLEVLSNRISVPPRDASLYLDGNTLVPLPGELGYSLNVEETMGTLTDDPGAVMLGGYLRLVLKPEPPRINDVSAAKAEAERLLNSKMSIVGYDPVTDEHFNWSVPQEVSGSWLKFEPGPQGLEVGIQGSKVAEYLSGLSDLLGPERWLDAAKYRYTLAEALGQGTQVTLIVNHMPTTYIVQPGDTLIAIGWKVGFPIWNLLEANPGLDPDRLLAGQELMVPSKDEMLPLPVILNKRIVLSISRQRLWMYQDGELLSKHVISTGIDRSPTLPGVFQIQSHDLNAYASVWDLYMPHFLSVYEAWPGFMNGIHGLPTLSSGRRLWAGVLGSPVSYGCIVMELGAAKRLYNWAENGVVFEIRP